ncbi:MAG: SUMF1/EgtB/PvdO family nonheme iron enzyme [Pyrinomonadaceae bacterium]
MKECQQCKRCYSDEVAICPDDGMPTFHTISGEPVLEGKYKLESRIGQGGMGVVYCSRHAYLKTQHAIKVILPDLVGNDPQLVTRFRQEALAAAAIRHHNVIAVTDFGVAQGTMPFLVMEFVEGESLNDLLEREKKLAPERAFELMAAICAGVGAAHRGGIVHRDLKPLNIMIQKDRHSMAEAVKILDFGLAKIKSGELLGSFIQAQTTGLMGSPYYMAPEQWADEDPDAAADIYSLGVMLFQMIAGDVPFKGSSIPAIMQKHLNSPPPSFADFGVSVSPQFELAVRHTLEKDRRKRTPSTEVLVEELRNAVGVSSLGSQTSGGVPAARSTGNLPVSTLHILTNPPQAKIFVNDVSIGQSQSDGWLLLEGVQSGNQRLRVSHDGYEDWQSEVFFDGNPKQIVAQLKNLTAPLSPVNQTMNMSQPLAGNTSPPQYGATQGAPNIIHQTEPSDAQNLLNQTAPQNWQNSQQPITQSMPPKVGSSPAKFVVIGILGVLLLIGMGIGAAFMTGLIGKTDANKSIVNRGILPSNSNVIVVQPTPLVIQAKNEMAEIPGGKFMMGRNDGTPEERPAHEVSVKDFWMDKTEVTNAEYAKFVEDTGYNAPANWANREPVIGEEMFPVVRVNVADVNKFIEWRNKRDGVEYRLPTEEEWEYAARNGGDNNLYPWGDKWEDRRAVLEQSAPKPVGSAPNGADKWGVQDLIGNVWEWTSSEFKAYPGAPGEIIRKNKTPDYVIRGGGFVSKPTGDKAVSSTTRVGVETTRQDGFLGFRLVRSN